MALPSEIVTPSVTKPYLKIIQKIDAFENSHSLWDTLFQKSSTGGVWILIGVASGITGKGGGRVFPLMFFTENFLLTYRENRSKEKSENGKEKKIVKVEGNWNGSGRSMKVSKGPFFFFFFAVHFLKPLFVWLVPNWEISIGKRHILHWEKIKLEKVTLPLLKNIPVMPLWVAQFNWSK